MFRPVAPSSAVNPREMSELEPLVSRRAFDLLYQKRQTFEKLLTVAHQAFADVLVFRMLFADVMQRCDEAERVRYAEHFRNIQRIAASDGTASAGGPDSSGSINLCISTAIDFVSSRTLGYTPYATYNSPRALGEETIVVFFHKDLKRVMLITASTAALRKSAVKIICGMGVVTPFDTSCAWCGNPAEGLKKCPCMRASYCGPACQRAHWALHKTQCPCSKRYVDLC